MRDIRLVIREAERDWCGTVRERDVALALAALSADPATLAELETAAAGFASSDASKESFGDFRAEPGDEPYGAGSAIIDLVARLIVVDSTYPFPEPRGSVEYRDERGETNIRLPYRLAEDWSFLRHGETSWRSVAETRRRERAQHPPQDVRAVLYGRPLTEFVARETREAFLRGAATESDDADEVYETLKNIHAAWLLTPRDDLRGACPRDAMSAHRDGLMRDLHDRSERWSRLDECPPGLDEASFAFRYGAVGTHEAVLYYGLVRELLWSSSDRLRELSEERQVSGRSETIAAQDFLATEAIRLERVRDEWLDAPDPELHLRTPRSVILRERRRLPEAVSGEAAMVDPDCPCCQMMRDLPGPVFWHLDGSEMDCDFG